VVDKIVIQDEQNKAFKLLKILNQAVNDYQADLKLVPGATDFYEDRLLILELVCLPILEDKNVLSLIKNNLLYSLSLSDYNFFKKIEAKLVNIDIVEDRNEFKESIKRVLLENNEVITPNYNIKFIKDWLKDYISQIGLETNNDLAKAQYMTKLKDNKKISKSEYEKLITLFKLYDQMNIPSNIPQGFEEEMPVVKNGKLYIFRKGILEPVPEIEKPVVNKIASVETGETRKKQVDSTPDPLQDLQETLNKYQPNSLEYKAIQQEIERLKKIKK